MRIFFKPKLRELGVGVGVGVGCGGWGGADGWG